MAKVNRVEEVLRSLGPSLSTDVAQDLVTKYQMSQPAARQAISRAVAPVKKLKGIQFSHRARFLYLSSDYGSNKFFHNLVSALYRTNHSCRHGLSALRDRGEILPTNHFKIASGAPKRQAKHLTADLLIENLLATNLVKLVNIDGIGECLALSKFDYEDERLIYPTLKSRLITEKLTLNAIRDWVKRLGLGSYNQVSIRDEGDVIPSAGPNYWDLSAPSYLYPLLGTSTALGGKKPGSFVCDIYLGKNISEQAIQGFVKKCLNVRGFRNMSPVLQMFIADSYSSEAIRLIKNSGAIAATIDTLLGKEVAEALSQLTSILGSTALTIDSREKLDAVFSTLGRVEGAANTLRGSLFEYIAAEIAQEHFLRPVIALNKHVRSSIGAAAEIDVFVTVGQDEIVFIECKGHKPSGTVDDAEVRKWLDNRIPVLRDWVKRQEDLRARPQIFELWTNARLTDASIMLITEANERSSRYQIEHKCGEELLAIIEKSKNDALLKTYKQHFTNHPLND